MVRLKKLVLKVRGSFLESDNNCLKILSIIFLSVVLSVLSVFDHNDKKNQIINVK
jgi:hypothetical protein